MLKNLLTLTVLLLSFNTFSQDNAWLTYYEKSGYLETPRYEQTIEYCEKLAAASGQIHYTSFGISPQGRDLPLLIIDKDGLISPEEIKKSGKAILLVQAGIHSGEIDGKDAGFMFIRDMVIHGKHPGLLDNLSILFIPIFSVDGHERFGPYNRINQDGPAYMGWRTTAQNLNLNRDFLKADSPEMQHWLVLFQKWLPDFMVDIHVTDGADYQYVSTYQVETHGNMDEALSEWTENVFIKEMTSEMESAGHLVFPYVQFRRWHDPRSGLRGSVASPRLSQGYTALQNRPGLLVENHSLKDYKTRVTATYEQMRIICKILNRDALILKDLNSKADKISASAAFTNEPLSVAFRPSQDSIMVEFKGVEYDILESDLTGGSWFVYHPDKPTTYHLPFFNDQEVVREVSMPLAYIIPPEWIEVIERLKLHGIRYKELTLGEDVMVEMYHFERPEFARSPYEGRFRVSSEYHPVEEVINFPEGSLVIPVNQRTSRVIAHIFEPDAPDSYFAWGFFSVIFEQKEYAETYVMEPLARKMLNQDPELKAEYLQKKEEDSVFASRQWSQLNWLFSKTDYWDERKNRYPVGRVVSREVLQELFSNTH